MNAYASRHRCNRLALVYPATEDCPLGRVTDFLLMTEDRPVLEIIAVDVGELALVSGLPTGFEEIIPRGLAREQVAVLPSAYAEA